MIARLGDRAIRVQRPPGVSARAIVEHARGWPGVVDVVVAREDIALYFAAPPALSQIDEVRIATLAALPDIATAAREHVLRVVYDGADLEEVARATRLSVDDVIARHAAATYVVDSMGFAPGFAYLDGLDPALAIPRRATPREQVPAGSVAIAGPQTAVYPFASPGGWHLLGHIVDAQMFDAAHGALLALGDRVRFTRA